MMGDTDRKKSVIASYGYIRGLIHRIDNVRLNPRMVLESRRKVARIYGHGIDDDEAISDLYSCLYNSFMITVRSIEEDHDKT